MIPKKFRVNRKEWLRGKGSHDSCLLREEDGQKCCLGFYALAKGINKKHILDVSSPGEMLPRKSGGNMIPELSDSGGDNAFCTELMMINDDEKLSDKVREKRLKQVFKTLGVVAEFYN